MTMDASMKGTLLRLQGMSHTAVPETNALRSDAPGQNLLGPLGEIFGRLLDELLQQLHNGTSCTCQGPEQGGGAEAGGTTTSGGNDTRTAPHVGLAEGLAAGDSPSGKLHVYRAPGATLPWDGLGPTRAVPQYWEAAMVPDARGLIGDQVAPGLEGWYELVASGEAHDYYGYRDYLEQNYPGGYAAWESDFDAYRRVALTGADLEFSITNTSGMRNGMTQTA